MADLENELKLRIDGNQSQSLPPPAYQQPEGYNAAPACYNTPPPANMNPIATQPVALYHSQNMPAGSSGAQQPISMAPVPAKSTSLVGQQQPVQWMVPSTATTGYLPGLESLTELDQINIAQQLNLIECKIDYLRERD